MHISIHASRRAACAWVYVTVRTLTVDLIGSVLVLRLAVGFNDSGVEADLVFRNVTAAMEEPRFTRHAGTRVVMDYTRLTQFGAWEGWVVIDGERIEVRPDEVLGSRDRSWGIRGVGERDAGAPGTEEPQ